jgi:hypothetical protein
MVDYVFNDVVPYTPQLDSDLPSVPGYQSYTHNFKTLTVTVSATLAIEDEDDLNDIIVSAKYAPTMPYKIYDYIPASKIADKYELPLSVDYITEVTKRLIPVKTRLYGELQSIIYYGERDASGNDTIPIVQENFYYQRSATTGLLEKRTQIIRWFFDDGTLDCKYKERVKYYDDLNASVSELKRVRATNIDDINDSIMPMIIATDPNINTEQEVIDEGRRFFAQYSMERDLYINDGNYALTQAVKDDTTFTWLDNDISAGWPGLTTIRAFIITQLTNGAE